MSRRALLLDYGGVLTAPVDDAFAAFEREQGMPAGAAFASLASAARTADGGVIGALERGELPIEDFEAELRAGLATAGYDVGSEVRLLDGLFAAMEPAGRLWELVDRARAAGVRTGLLSNSWGFSPYPMAELEARFDDIVLSGAVGLRKPDPAIYRLAADRLGVAPTACVFVDDLAGNVRAAARLGMGAVHHTGDDAVTWAAVTQALGLPPDHPGGT
ncbi:MAG: HAD family hydrolase [Nitriliruptoraceae bacterium]